MAEYIKRNVVTKGIMAAKWMDGYDGAMAMEIAASAPVADVAPVAHGRWKWFCEETGTPSTGYESEWGWRCSHCGEELPDDYDDPDDIPTFRFCYNCGAKMDGGADNGQS